VRKLATELKTEIGGEFIFENGRLSFVDDSGRSVDKNLISFGMTNLGLFYLLAKFLEVTHRFQDCIIHSKTNPHKHSSIHFLILLNSQ
jgi:hypothetical protein